ncbi:hypothetical protein WR25_22909 [Diploscapter pachys]|uniref:Helicase ATP-binding domain-containing protein n=1 Tax=Diploscapter pachys TaxID=2018661 RepID=A0A2A2M4T8_9BILA|nr:hypothetical protein WR25_22909 [Diploscapter pachys]
MDSKRSAATRVTVVTEGIFVARIQADPELTGVSAVLFDEVHERSLDGDFGLALALEAQGALRPDLRLVAMSATLDGARFSRLLGATEQGAPVIESEGRSYPLALRYLGRSGDGRIEDAMASAIRQALREAEGGVLAGWRGCRRRSACITCMAAWSRRRSARRSAPSPMARASWCWRRGSPRPA